MDFEKKPEPVDSAAYFGDSGIRYEKGTGLDIISAERIARIEKSARLKAAREARGPLPSEDVSAQTPAVTASKLRKPRTKSPAKPARA